MSFWKSKVTWVVLGVFCIVTAGGAYYFNNKLNSQYRSIYKEIENKTITKYKPDYEFPEYYPSLKYSPTGEYLMYNPKDAIPVNPNINLHDFDDKGVKRNEVQGEMIYHPSNIAYLGLNEYSKYLTTKDEASLTIAKNQAEYILTHIDPQTNLITYSFDFVPSGTNGVKAPWGSAISQGQSISLMVRLYNLTKDQKYLTAAQTLMKPFYTSVANGGLQSKFQNTYTVLEEYPTNPPSYVLNGFIFGIVGVYDYATITGDEQAKALYEDCKKSLVYMLPYYDSKDISLYHLTYITDPPKKQERYPSYHSLHVYLLQTVNQFMKDTTITFYSDLWDSYVQAIK